VILVAGCFVFSCGKWKQEPPLINGGAGTETHVAASETPKECEEVAAATPAPEVSDENPQKADASFLSLNKLSKTEKAVFGLIQVAEIFLIGYLSIKLFKVTRFPRQKVFTCLLYSHKFIENLRSWVDCFRVCINNIKGDFSYACILEKDLNLTNWIDATISCLVTTKYDKTYVPIFNDFDDSYVIEANKAYLTQEDKACLTQEECELIDQEEISFSRSGSSAEAPVEDPAEKSSRAFLKEFGFGLIQAAIGFFVRYVFF